MSVVKYTESKKLQQRSNKKQNETRALFCIKRTNSFAKIKKHSLSNKSEPDLLLPHLSLFQSFLSLRSITYPFTQRNVLEEEEPTDKCYSDNLYYFWLSQKKLDSTWKKIMLIDWKLNLSKSFQVISIENEHNQRKPQSLVIICNSEWDSNRLSLNRYSGCSLLRVKDFDYSYNNLMKSILIW